MNKKLKTLREKDDKALATQLKELRHRLVEVTPRMAVGEIKDLKTKKKLRAEIAQILGIMRERELTK